MANMCRNGHLDIQLFRYFLHSGLWHTFAQRFMSPAQIDDVDASLIESLLPSAPEAPPTV